MGHPKVVWATRPEKALGKVPNQPSPENVQAVEEILKQKEEPKKEEPN
jgi:hypothetical protein